MGLLAGTPEETSATVTYVFFFVFMMTLGAFGVVIALGRRGETLDGFQGVAAQRPGVAALMLLFLLPLTGTPLTAGFTAKFEVIASAVRAGQVPLAVLAVRCSVVAALVYLRITGLMYMRKPEEPEPSRFPVPVTPTPAVAVLVAHVGGNFAGSLLPWVVPP